MLFKKRYTVLSQVLVVRFVRVIEREREREECVCGCVIEREECVCV